MTGEILGILGAITGLYLTWRTFKLKLEDTKWEWHKSVMADMEQIITTLQTENARLQQKINRLQQELEEEVLKRTALAERLDIERDIFSRRLEELGTKLDCEYFEGQVNE